MTVLVTGATGFLGQDLVSRLLVQGQRVRVLARSGPRARPLIERGVEAVIGDLTDPITVEAALGGVEVVYHLAGQLFVPGVPEAEYHATHVEGTRTILSCCQDRPQLRRFIHASTTGVLGVTGVRAANEDAPAAPTNAYERTKWEAERLVTEAIDRGFPAVIVRPGLVYGPGDLHLLGLFRAIQRRLFRPIGGDPVWLHPIYIDDLTDGLLLCAERPEALGECFHFAGRQPATIATLGATIAAAVGTSLPPGTVPLWLAGAVAAAGDFLPSRLRHLAPLTRSRLDFLTNSRVYDVTRAQRLLGFVAGTDLSTGIDHAVAWYRQNGYLPGGSEDRWPGRSLTGANR